MIVINSNRDDFSTMMVVKWLRHLDKPFLLLLENQSIENITYNQDGASYFRLKDGSKISFEDISAYWYRRGRGRFMLSHKKPNSRLKQFNNRVNKFIETEDRSFSKFIDYKLSQKKHLNKLSTSGNVNKLILMDIAEQVGLKIPPSIVTSEKTILTKFVEQHREVITKPLEASLSYLSKHHWMPMYTEIVRKEMLADLPNNFHLSLFQKKIEKKYELRVFHLNGKNYAMAIFSQRDQQTSVDFRNYNLEKPNRNVPFKLPKDYSKRLNEFMKATKYNCGSFDILVDKKNNYYFLELNPVGQFGMVSLPCNYYLEKKIAEFL